MVRMQSKILFGNIFSSNRGHHRNILFCKMSKKAQVTEAIVDIAALFFLILLFVIAFVLAGSHKDKITRDLVNLDIKGLSLEYASLNLVRQNSTHGSISEEIRMFCKNEISRNDLAKILEYASKKILKPEDKITFELKDSTCSNNFKKSFTNLPAGKKQTNCANSYKTQVVIANIKQNPIILDVSMEYCVVKNK
jgi:hypothetical protein